MLEVINDPTGGSRSLRFGLTPNTRINHYVAFASKGISSTARHIYAYWQGQFDGYFDLDMWLGDSNGTSRIASLRLNNYGLYPDHRPSILFLEQVSIRSHVILFAVDKAAGTWDVTFLWRDGERRVHSRKLTDIPVLDPIALATERPVLFMRYAEPGGAGSGGEFYLINEVTISETEPRSVEP